MKRIIVIALLGSLIYACGGEPKQQATATERPKSMLKVDDGKGIGEIKSVSLNTPLKGHMVETGEGIYEMKCSACHKLTDQRVVGPGFKGVTDRRQPEWIMNMITNVDVMLAEDATAQKLLEECLTRMPNQNLTVGDARDVLEFLYANDGVEVGE